MLKRENWKGKYYFVVRDSKKRIRAKTYVKGWTKQSAQSYYEDYKTFKKSSKGKPLKLDSDKLTNFTENTLLSNSNIGNKDSRTIYKRPKGKKVQYVVQGVYKKSLVVARSPFIDGDRVNNAREAKEMAWDNFLKRLSKKAGFVDYDADEGVKVIDDVTNIKEGWVWYVKNNKTD